ncbi:5506_t:CDS:2 [Gigaspora rosea]|nr:5506_t:CDS:2 [Gigaspora rosea]
MLTELHSQDDFEEYEPPFLSYDEPHQDKSCPNELSSQAEPSEASTNKSLVLGIDSKEESLVREVFERQSLKGVPFKTFDAATDEDIEQFLSESFGEECSDSDEESSLAGPSQSYQEHEGDENNDNTQTDDFYSKEHEQNKED